MALKKAKLFGETATEDLCSLPTDTTGKLDVFGHDGHSFGVDSAQVGVLEETDQVCFAGLLEGHDCAALESEVSLEVLCDLTDQTLEWQFSDQQFGALLVTTDLSQGDCSRPVTMWFLHTSGSWCTLPGGLCCQLFTRSLSSGRFTGGLLCTSHVDVTVVED